MKKKQQRQGRVPSGQRAQAERIFQRGETYGLIIPCPRCGGQRNYLTLRQDVTDRIRELLRETRPPALSRTDNTTFICEPCGQNEALRAWINLPLPPQSEWPVTDDDVDDEDDTDDAPVRKIIRRNGASTKRKSKTRTTTRSTRRTKK